MLVGDISINAKVPWLSYTSEQQDFRSILFRQPPRIVTYRLVVDVRFHANMANVAVYTCAAKAVRGRS